MTRKQYIKNTLILGLVVLAIGGWFLHLRIHSPFMVRFGLVPLFSGILSVFIVPLFFLFRPTFAYAYVINGFTVILGTIVMAHFSIYYFNGIWTLPNLLLNTLLADIAILWGKFAVGKALFDLELLNTDKDVMPQGRYFRYPNMGWWLVHLAGWSIVYTLGVMFWK
ncbi:MAG: hypothetical protein WC645_06980 [Candidatus Margulisiibacteriota bacterium]